MRGHFVTKLTHLGVTKALERICGGRTMKQEIPWVVVDTGTLLTLLLGGEGKHGLGYTPLLAELAKKKLIHLAIPDMVLSEFMGALTPLRRKDFVGDEKF